MIGQRVCCCCILFLESNGIDNDSSGSSFSDSDSNDTISDIDDSDDEEDVVAAIQTIGRLLNDLWNRFAAVDSPVVVLFSEQ